MKWGSFTMFFWFFRLMSFFYIFYILYIFFTMYSLVEHKTGRQRGQTHWTSARHRFSPTMKHTWARVTPGLWKKKKTMTDSRRAFQSVHCSQFSDWSKNLLCNMGNYSHTMSAIQHLLKWTKTFSEHIWHSRWRRCCLTCLLLHMVDMRWCITIVVCGVWPQCRLIICQFYRFTNSASLWWPFSKHPAH